VQASGVLALGVLPLVDVTEAQLHELDAEAVAVAVAEGRRDGSGDVDVVRASHARVQFGQEQHVRAGSSEQRGGVGGAGTPLHVPRRHAHPTGERAGGSGGLSPCDLVQAGDLGHQLPMEPVVTEPS